MSSFGNLAGRRVMQSEPWLSKFPREVCLWAWTWSFADNRCELPAGALIRRRGRLSMRTGGRMRTEVLNNSPLQLREGKLLDCRVRFCPHVHTKIR